MGRRLPNVALAATTEEGAKLPTTALVSHLSMLMHGVIRLAKATGAVAIVSKAASTGERVLGCTMCAEGAANHWSNPNAHCLPH